MKAFSMSKTSPIVETPKASSAASTMTASIIFTASAMPRPSVSKCLSPSPPGKA